MPHEAIGGRPAVGHRQLQGREALPREDVDAAVAPRRGVLRGRRKVEWKTCLRTGDKGHRYYSNKGITTSSFELPIVMPFVRET